MGSPADLTCDESLSSSPDLILDLDLPPHLNAEDFYRSFPDVSANRSDSVGPDPHYLRESERVIAFYDHLRSRSPTEFVKIRVSVCLPLCADRNLWPSCLSCSTILFNYFIQHDFEDYVNYQYNCYKYVYFCQMCDRKLYTFV